MTQTHATATASRRQRPPRLAGRRLTKIEMKIGALVYPERFARPATRAECAEGPRPCPFIGCRHNLYLDFVSSRDPGLEPWDMPPAASCSLDIADAGGHSQVEVATILGVTRQRVHQIERNSFRRHHRTWEDML